MCSRPEIVEELLIPALDILDSVIRRLQRSVHLNDEDCASLLRLPYTYRRYRQNELIMREGDRAKNVTLLLSGFAYRHKAAGNGGRQIFSIQMKGDLVDLQNAIFEHADHNVQALTDVDAAVFSAEAFRVITAERPNITRALWRETLTDAATFREWALNIGRRDARSRTAHLLCEVAVRSKNAGLSEQYQYDFPMSQEQLADALALTNVHVSRTIKGLIEEGVINRMRHAITIYDFDRLAMIGDFDPSYLHAN